MQLLVAHQILIGAASALAVLFGLRSMVLFSRGGATVNLVLTVVSVLVAGLLMTYFRKVRAQWRAQRAARPGR
jgi:hypothetical protein